MSLTYSESYIQLTLSLPAFFGDTTRNGVHLKPRTVLESSFSNQGGPLQMRGWIWAGPGRAGSGCNYREDIWDHVGAQMALSAADLWYPTPGHAALCVCVYILYICVFFLCSDHTVRHGGCGPLQTSEPLPVAFSASVILRDYFYCTLAEIL